MNLRLTNLLLVTIALLLAVLVVSHQEPKLISEPTIERYSYHVYYDPHYGAAMHTRTNRITEKLEFRWNLEWLSQIDYIEKRSKSEYKSLDPGLIDYIEKHSKHKSHDQASKDSP